MIYLLAHVASSLFWAGAKMRSIILIMAPLKWSLILSFSIPVYGFIWYLTYKLIQQGGPAYILGVPALLAYLWVHVFIIGGLIYNLVTDSKFVEFTHSTPSEGEVIEYRRLNFGLFVFHLKNHKFFLKKPFKWYFYGKELMQKEGEWVEDTEGWDISASNRIKEYYSISAN